MLTPEIRFQALSLRLRADEARAESQAADAALAKAGEMAKVAKEAAKETEEAAQEAELKALKLPGGLYDEPSPLAVELARRRRRRMRCTGVQQYAQPRVAFARDKLQAHQDWL